MITYETKRQLGTSTGPEKRGLKIGHLNVCKMLSKMTNIGNFMKMHKFDVFAISETWLKHSDGDIDEKLEIEGYQKIVRADRQLKKKTGGGGVAVYIREGIECTFIPHPEQNDEDTQYIHIVVKTNCLGKPIPYIHISAFYFSPESKKMERLLAILDNHLCFNNVIALGDVNIDLFVLPCGKYIEGVDDRGFCQLIKEITHPKRGKFEASLIDHIYVKKSQAEDMISQSGVIQCRISDHDLICCTVGPAFMDRRLGTPEEMLRTIIRGSGHVNAKDKLSELCRIILCRMAASESTVGIDAVYDDDHLKEITNTDYNYIISQYGMWYKQFGNEFGDNNCLEHEDLKVFFIHADTRLKFLWLAIGMPVDQKVEKFVFLDYNKWYEKTNAKHLDSLQAYGAGGGRSALVVMYRVTDDKDSDEDSDCDKDSDGDSDEDSDEDSDCDKDSDGDSDKHSYHDQDSDKDSNEDSDGDRDKNDDSLLWKIYAVYKISQLNRSGYNLQCSDRIVGCEISKKDTSDSTFTKVLGEIISVLRKISFVKVEEWVAFGNYYVLKKKVDKVYVQQYIKEKYDVDML